MNSDSNSNTERNRRGRLIEKEEKREKRKIDKAVIGGKKFLGFVHSEAGRRERKRGMGSLFLPGIWFREPKRAGKVIL